MNPRAHLSNQLGEPLCCQFVRILSVQICFSHAHNNFFNDCNYSTYLFLIVARVEWEDGLCEAQSYHARLIELTSLQFLVICVALAFVFLWDMATLGLGTCERLTADDAFELGKDWRLLHWINFSYFKLPNMWDFQWKFGEDLEIDLGLLEGLLKNLDR